MYKHILEASLRTCKEQTAGGCWVRPCNICSSASTRQRESSCAVDERGRGQRCFRQFSTSQLICNVCCLGLTPALELSFPSNQALFFVGTARRFPATMSPCQVSKQICLKVPGLGVISPRWGEKETEKGGKKNQDKKTFPAGILYCDYFVVLFCFYELSGLLLHVHLQFACGKQHAFQ